MVNSNLTLIKQDPKKAIRLLMVPVMLSCLFESLNSVIDSVWVSGLGSNALAALGFVSPVFIALVGLGIGLGIGINSIVSRFLGGNNLQEANNAAIHSVFLSVIISVIITVVLLFFLKDLLVLLGASSVLNEATTYGFYLFLGSFSLLMPQMFSGILMAEGEVKKATYPLILIAIINIFLDPIFIYVFNLQIAGAAIATVISQIIGLLIICYWLFIKNNTSFTYKRENYKRKLKIYKDILLIGIPAGLEEIVMAILCIIINLVLVIVSGNDSVAAFSVAWRVISIGIVPTIAIGSASVTVAGIAYGAQNFQNLKITTQYASLLAFIFALAICIILNIFSNQIAFIFAYSDNSAYLAPLIAHSIQLASFFLLPAAFGDVATYVLQGMGKGIKSFLLILTRELFMSALFVFIFALILNLGADGVLIGLNIGTLVGSLIAYIFTRYYIFQFEKSY